MDSDNAVPLILENAELKEQLSDYKSALWRVAHEALDLYGAESEQEVANKIEFELKISAAARKFARKGDEQ